MKKIEVLDCTLRDGGYVNNWNFGTNNIKEIINGLSNSGIDYIECGFISDNKTYDENKTIFPQIKLLNNFLNEKGKTKLALMMLPHEYDINFLPNIDRECPIIIRLSFHKCDFNKAVDYAKEIKKKGYELFFQPTVIMDYSQEEILKIIQICNNEIKPDGVAIVDTIGEMNMNDVKKITSIFDKYLNNKTKLLFHGHNNCQLAFSNAITFIENTSQDRNIVVDTSLLGMGKDAGNVCTELIINYLNRFYKYDYNFEIIIDIIDKIMWNIRLNYKWGYMPAFMLNAKNRTHPNYGKLFRENISNIKLTQLDKLLGQVPEKKKSNYNEKIARDLLEMEVKNENSCCNSNEIK